MNKEKIRKTLKEKRKNLSQKEISEKSQKIVEKILKQKQFQNSKNILIYYPIQNEVNLLKLFEIKTKNFYLPSIKNEKLEIKKLTTLKDLKKGKFQIKEVRENKTSPPNKIDLIIIPGIAFDREKNRIGFGKGFYDKFLKNTSAHKIATCYDFQLLDKIPQKKHDIKMDTIITENQSL